MVWRTESEFDKVGKFLIGKTVAVFWYSMIYHKNLHRKKATVMEVSHNNAQGSTADRKRANNLARKVQRLKRKLKKQSRLLAIAKEQLLQANDTIARNNDQIEFLNQQAASSTDTSKLNLFFTDPNVFGHRFAASMVALCVNLANVMPYRAVSRALHIVTDALSVATLIPDRETIMRWTKRLGVDRLKQNQMPQKWKDHEDMIWIVDHSNQIGTQKVLVVLAIPASKLPPEGQTLSLDDLEVLAIEPGDSWKRDDVRRVYKKLAESVGRPRFVLCDGAVELRESVDVLRDDDHEVVVLRDFKHFAANRFESMIGRTERFKSFQSLMGKTRCQIQQTELAHLTPPGLKTKSRFMNIAPTIAWAYMVLGVLDDPEADEAGVQDVAKLEDRMGWLNEYRDEIENWHRCCEVIDLSLAWINTKGLWRNSGCLLAQHLAQARKDHCELSDQLQEQLVEFVMSSCEQLKDGERSWLSSETLESAFGLFKRREGQQSRSGFTGLIATLPSLIHCWTPAEVRAGLRRTSTKEAKQWIADHVGTTLSAKRKRAFKHFGKPKCHIFSTA